VGDTATSLKLTYDGARKLLDAAIEATRAANTPQCICVVDAGGHLLAMARMDGAFSMSFKTALRKAQTSAAYGVPTGAIPQAIELKLAIGTDGDRINLPGGLPVIVDGHLIGAIGIGSGTSEQDRAVAAAALHAIKGAQHFD
jgi:glc operon protein GlcG